MCNGRTSKTETRTTTAGHLDTKTSEPRSIIKHFLWAPNTQVSLDRSFYTKLNTTL